MSEVVHTKLGNVGRGASSWKVRLALRGFTNPPRAVVNTNPVSRQREPAATRSSSCLLRCDRWMPTKGAGIGRTDTDVSVFTESSRSWPSTRLALGGSLADPHLSPRRPKRGQGLLLVAAPSRAQLPTMRIDDGVGCLKEPYCFLVREASNLAIVGDP